MIDIVNLKPERATLFVLLTINLLAPGVLELFFLRYDIFKELDIFKLLLLSSSFGSPFLVLAYLTITALSSELIHIKNGQYKGEKMDYLILMYVASYASLSWFFTLANTIMFSYVFPGFSSVELCLFTIASFITIFIVYAFSIRSTIKAEVRQYKDSLSTPEIIYPSTDAEGKED